MKNQNSKKSQFIEPVTITIHVTPHADDEDVISMDIDISRNATAGEILEYLHYASDDVLADAMKGAISGKLTALSTST